MKAAYRVTLRSIGTFDGVNVILVNYLLLPLVSLIMFLLIAFGASQDYSRILVEIGRASCRERVYEAV